VLQRLMWLAILTVIIAWIVLSYLPSSVVTLPTLAFSPRASAWLAALAPLTLAAFVAIQTWLVYATWVAVRRYRPRAGEAAPARPPLGAELFWTALPIAITLAVAWAGHGLWMQAAAQ
jgi:heme/copper-type cytochrome/quinol oxidase subunit 2